MKKQSDICSVDGCCEKPYGRNLCRKHYVRFMRGKNPHTKSQIEKTHEQRILDKVEMVTESGCWIWTACLSDTGYGSINGKSAHRESYRVFNGEIPYGMQVMHICDVRQCVNPNHLKLGTAKENMQDAVKKNRIAYGYRLPQYKHGKYVTHICK